MKVTILSGIHHNLTTLNYVGHCKYLRNWRKPFSPFQPGVSLLKLNIRKKVGFRVWGLGLLGLGFRVQDFRVWGLGFPGSGITKAYWGTWHKLSHITAFVMGGVPTRIQHIPSVGLPSMPHAILQEAQ